MKAKKTVCTTSKLLLFSIFFFGADADCGDRFEEFKEVWMLVVSNVHFLYIMNPHNINFSQNSIYCPPEFSDPFTLLSICFNHLNVFNIVTIL